MDVIHVSDVKKSFRVYFDKGASLKEKLLFQNRNRYEQRTVLNGVSFSVRRGEAVGLIGKNGCGKSTMLKLLSKIMYPDEGRIAVEGRVSSLIELGAGFHPDMSGRENIYTNAAIFGLTKQEIDARLQKIIDFSELDDYIDNPVRTYSSGMYMRLAFSVAINVDADILLIDEILAVGDVAFQSKCFQKLREIKAQGTTIVIVSHSLGQIEEFCERTIWLDQGKVRQVGLPQIVHPIYLEHMNHAESVGVPVEETSTQDMEDTFTAETQAEQEKEKKEDSGFPWMFTFLQQNAGLQEQIPAPQKDGILERGIHFLAKRIWIYMAPTVAQQSHNNEALIALCRLLYEKNRILEQTVAKQLSELASASAYYAQTLENYSGLFSEMAHDIEILKNSSSYFSENLGRHDFLIMEAARNIEALKSSNTYFSETLERHDFLVMEAARNIEALKSSNTYFSENLGRHDFLIMEAARNIEALKSSNTYFSETLERHDFLVTEVARNIETLKSSNTYFSETLERHDFLVTEATQNIETLKNSSAYFSETLEHDHFLLTTMTDEIEMLKNNGVYYANTLQDHHFWLEQQDRKIKTLHNEKRLEQIRRHYQKDETAVSADSVSQIIQLVPVLKARDAIGNYALTLKGLMNKHGINNSIVYLEVDADLRQTGIGYDQMPIPARDDILVLHMAAENLFADELEAYGCKKVLFYHNITPPAFFEKDSFNYTSTQRGLAQVKKLCNLCDFCITSSQYNRKSLMELGCTVPIRVLPLLTDFTQYQLAPDSTWQVRLSDGKKNFLFVGRIVPNKCQHDLIAAYVWYKEHISESCRLLLVGKYDETDPYYRSIKENLPDGVEMTGLLSQEAVNACYRSADLFLCASEHEGVCVPLMEAMYFSVPIVAFESSAVPETLGEGGVLLQDKAPQVWGETMTRVLEDTALQNQIKQAQARQLARFQPSTVAEESIALLKNLNSGV